MIAHQWETAGVSRVHLGLLRVRQFEISERGRLKLPQAQAQRWLLDDFRGSWVEPDPQAWLVRVRDCIAAVLAGPAPQRHAVVLPTAMVEALSGLLKAPGGPAGTFGLFDCAVEARHWASSLPVPRSLAGKCREVWRRPGLLHGLSPLQACTA